MKNTFSLLFIIVLLFKTFLGFSQKSRQELLGSWFVVSGNHKITEKWSIPTVGILRHYDFFNDYEFSFFRTGLTHHLKKNVVITLGGAYLDSKGFNDTKKLKDAKQFWIYEEATFNSKFKLASLANRIRVENRWIYKRTRNSFNLRFRYRIQAKKSIYKNYLYVKLFNEIFFNLNSSKFFNQNRFFIGMGTGLAKNVKFEVGYLKNHFNPNHYNRLRMVLIFNTKLRRK